jgi:hypothetical protein
MSLKWELWGPVHAGLCTLKELQNGTYGIRDLFDFFEYIEVKSFLDAKMTEAINGKSNYS